MLKSITALLFSLSLMLTIVTPTLLLLLDLDSNAIAMVEITEEELQKKPGKQVDHNKILDNLYPEVGFISFGKSSGLFSHPCLNASSFCMEVLIPPPETNA